MDNKLNAAVRNAVRRLDRWSFFIVVLMSSIHIGLAYIHVRDSGGTVQRAAG